MQAHVYQSSSDTCAAFLANWDTNDATVEFQGQSYDLPAWSVSILPDCKSVVYNSASVRNMDISLTLLECFKFRLLQIS